MIDSIDTNAAAPAGDADFSSAAPLEAESPAGSIPATPASSGLLGEDGSFVPEWYSRFEELKGTEKSLAKFKTPEALARSYTELERLRRYPGVDNEEQMARFRQMAGLPDSEEDYRLERPETMPEEEWNPELAERMARAAYRYGVPPEAKNALQDTMAQAYQEAREKVQEQQMEQETQAEQSLQNEWGGSYERNMGRATAALQRLASETGWMRTPFWTTRPWVPIRTSSACCTRSPACWRRRPSIRREQPLPPRLKKPCGWSRTPPIPSMRHT